MEDPLAKEEHLLRFQEADHLLEKKKITFFSKKELFFKKKAAGAQKEVLEEETAAMVGASHASPLLSVPEVPPHEHSNETGANNVPSDPVKMNPLTRGGAHGNEQS